MRSAIAFLIASVPLHAAPTAPEAADFFENKVRPVLANNCYACHTNSEMGGLRVDSREALLKGGKTGPALMPGDPEKSLLIQAVRQTGELKMPKGGKLKAQDVAALADWVKMGAPWPETAQTIPVSKSKQFTITPEQRKFWSFQPLRQPELPQVKEKSWAKTNVDHFVLAKLESEGLKPVAAADRRTLIRRATLDLIGLPPTPDEIDAFVADKSPHAFEKVVDRLLASPQYGERWGRHWLDVVRYAEDDVRGLDPKDRGYMPFNGAYVYRDWVIQAFNQDLPFDSFVKAQLAGDLDEKLRTKTVAGTAMLGQGPWWWDQAEPVQGRADERNERIDLVSRGFLGLTVACARCHNHKYDPISQQDYYALAGVFLNTTYTEYPTSSPAETAAWQKQQKKIDDLEEELDKFISEEGKLYAEVVAHKTAKYLVAAWKVTGEPKMKLPDAASEEKVDPELLEKWIKFLGRPQKHYPYLLDWQDMVKTGGTLEQAQFLANQFQDVVLTVLAEAKELKKENDIIKAKADVKEKPHRDAYPNEFETKDQFCPGCDLELKTMQPLERSNVFLDVFVYDLDSESEQKPEPGLLGLRDWSLERHFSTEVTEHLASLRTQIDALKKALPQQYPFVHGVGDTKTIQNMHVNVRGNPNNLGDEVPRRFLAVLSTDDSKPFSKGSGRLELADAVVASPIAARVIVNRVWKWHFGTGIVDTPSNFGQMGERPTNPELLEYLAKSFMDSGMSFKKLHREILLSSAYQLSTEASSVNQEKDPANRWYWRANRRRLDAEAIRDSVLYASGALDLKKVGGPSIDFAPDNDRRTVYCKVSRYRLSDFLQVFDFPNPSFTAEQRFSTNVPLQRLFFMNSAFVYRQADRLAKRVYDEGNDEARIKKAYRLLYGRVPTDAEMKAGLDFVHANPEKPGNQIAGEPPTPWKQYARVLLSSNEFEFVN